jgi:hypothetical protein
MLYTTRQEMALTEIEALAMYRALEIWCKGKNTEKFMRHWSIAMAVRFGLLGEMWRKCEDGTSDEFLEQLHIGAEGLSTEELLDELARRGINVTTEREADDKEVLKSAKT